MVVGGEKDESRKPQNKRDSYAGCHMYSSMYVRVFSETMNLWDNIGSKNFLGAGSNERRSAHCVEASRHGAGRTRSITTTRPGDIDRYDDE